MAYDDANATVRREHCTGAIGGASTTAYGHFTTFQKAKLKAIHGVVSTPGTAAGHKYDVYIGSSSVASFAFATGAVGVTSSITLGSDMASLDDGAYLQTGADVTGRAVFTWEYEVEPDAVRT
jgi:hypothetical protein